MKANSPSTSPATAPAPTIAPSEPITVPRPKTPFSPSIEPETTPKG